jgi:hypothetical protein
MGCLPRKVPAAVLKKAAASWMRWRRDESLSNQQSGLNFFFLVVIRCSIKAEHLKIYRLEKGIEHFSLNVTQHIRHFHQYIVAIGSSILEIPCPKSHD